MTTQEKKEKLKGAIQNVIKREFDRSQDIWMINLSTSDGFQIRSYNNDSVNTDGAKMSAMSSTLFSLSEAFANVLDDNLMSITSIETQNAHFLFVKTNILNQSCVLSLIVSTDVTLAEGRFSAKRLSAKLESLPAQIAGNASA